MGNLLRRYWQPALLAEVGGTGWRAGPRAAFGQT